SPEGLAIACCAGGRRASAPLPSKTAAARPFRWDNGQMSSIDETHIEDAAGRESPNEDGPLLAGMEINLGDFTRTQGLMKSLRLMINNQVVVQVEDISSGVSDAGRKFKMGDVEQANQDVA